MNKWIITILLLATFVLRWQTWTLPLNRDEGMYAFAASRLFHADFVLYRDLFEHKPPGIQLLYWAMFQFTGASEFSVRLLGFVNSVVSGLLIYLLLIKFSANKNTANLFTAIYILLANSFLLEGQLSNTEVFMSTFLLAELWLLDKNFNHKPMFLGLLSGFSLLIKPVAFVNLLLIFIILFFKTKHDRVRTLLFFATGTLVPIISVIYWFAQTRGLTDFFNQVVLFNKFYVETGIFESITKHGLIPWLVTLPPLALVLIGSTVVAIIFSKTKITSNFLILVMWFLAYYLGAKITSRNVAHYYFPMIQSSILLMAWLWQYYSARKIIVLALCFIFFRWGWLFFCPPSLAYTYTFGPTTKYAYDGRAIGLKIKKMTPQDAQVFMWYDDPELLFYSDRRPTTKYANTFGLPIPGALEELKSGLSKSPAVIVTYENTDWISEFVEKNNYLPDLSFQTAKLYWRQ